MMVFSAKTLLLHREILGLRFYIFKDQSNTQLKKVQELPWWPKVNLDGKPPTYCSRMMGECKRMYITEGAKEANVLEFCILYE